MPTKYHVRPNSVDSHQADPYWMALVVRYEESVTFDRDLLVTNEKAFEVGINPGVVANKERKPLILSNAITAWSISNS